MPTWAVTGGGGFIGSNIVARLVHRGDPVRVVDDFSTGRRSNLEGVRDDITLYEGSITDVGLLAEAFDGADYVLHQAAVASVQRTVEDPIGTDRVNVSGTLKVLEAARQASVERVVYASSTAVYGDSEELPKQEDMHPEPKSPYAANKLAGEYYCRVYNDLYGMETVGLRYFNIFGPRQDPNSDYAAVVPIFVRCALEDRPATVFGDGEQTRDFTYVENAVQANLLAAKVSGAAGSVFNIGCGESYTLNTLLDMLGSILEKRVDREYTSPRAGDVRHSAADISRAREILGYSPDVAFEEGLRHTVAWYSEDEKGGAARESDPTGAAAAR